MDHSTSIDSAPPSTSMGGGHRRRRRQRQQAKQEKELQKRKGETIDNNNQFKDHPIHHFNNIVGIVLMFLTLIGIAVIMSSSKGTSSTEALSSSQQQKSPLYTNPNDIPDSVLQNLDAIVVLGGGRPTSLEEPPIYVQKRADDAREVVKRLYDLKKNTDGNNNKSLREPGDDDDDAPKSIIPILCLSAGTAHLPQAIDAKGLPLWESTSTAAYLMKDLSGEDDSSNHIHIPPSDIYVETTSFDTIGNAYFARTGFTEFNGWRRLLVITNEFHMSRSQIIFDWMFTKCGIPVPVEGINNDKKRKRGGRRSNDPNGYQLYYLSSPNVGLTKDAIQARKEREDASSQNLKTNIIPKYSGNLGKVWTFLTHEHALYNAKKLVERGKQDSDENVSAEIRKSYGGASK